MEFKIVELTDNSQNYLEITTDKNCLQNAKSFKEGDKIKIDFNSLFLSTCLYGSSKKESIKIQKDNCKKMLAFYKVAKKVFKFLVKQGIFDGTIFVDNLPKKKNNNDLMLVALLNVDFNFKAFSKMKGAYEGACDFLDAENSLNKMCDFYDNHCANHRENGIDKTTGCCPSFCKIRVTGAPCKHKNLSCKIFMCDYLINQKGFYFTPNTLAVLKKHTTLFERAVCFGMLCKTEKKSLTFLWFIRIASFITTPLVLLLLGLLIF